MTMNRATKSVAAGVFKARCLALLDEVARTGETLVVTKRNKPVARIVPVEKGTRSSLRGSVTFHGDVVGPILDKWEIEN
jgi:prevent-host-death family protein